MSAPIYRTDYPADCLTHPLDGLMLVYHRPSGATHFLIDPTSDMLAILAEAPCDADMLARRLCHRIGTELDDEALEVTAQRLEELLDSGLIRAA